jgi:hypothetical protein
LNETSILGTVVFTKRHERALIAILISIVLLLNGYPLLVYAQAIPHEEIMWGAGYWPALTNFNPIRMNDGMGWDTYLMYEPLFGVNVASGELIKWLGKNIQWEDDGKTVHVTLRDGIYWVKLTDAGPEYYRDITTEDVKYTYFLTGAFPNSPPAAYWMDGLADRVDESQYPGGFEIVNATDFKIHINATYAYSTVVWRVMTRGYLIVPKEVWMAINATTGDYLAFNNDWLAPSFNPEWKVASGMYLPWYRSADLKQTIMMRNEKWWGINVFGKGPAPKYVGYLVGIPNDQIIQYVKSGSLDWDGSYIPAIWDKTEFPYSNTYFKNPPYFPDKSALLMVPNHRKYPLNEPWLHWAIAKVLDYAANSAASSGYCVNGSKYNVYGTQIQYPNAFLIPKDDAIANELLINYPNKDAYLIQRNVAEALALIQANCVDENGGTWTKGETAYTKGTTEALTAWAQNLKDYYGDIDLTVGTKTKKASVWIAGGFGDADELPDVEGINVKLGPWKLIDIDGWTDVCAIDGIVASTVTSELGVTLETDFLDWGGYTTAMDANTYDFADYCMHWGINGDLYERYTQLFAGTYSGCWNHYGSYVNTTLIELIESLDTTPDKQTVANHIFDIVGTDLPIIPISGHPDWYIYSNKYWGGWPNQDNPFLPASPYGGAAQEANLHYMLLSLVSSAIPTPLSPDIEALQKAVGELQAMVNSLNASLNSLNASLIGGLTEVTGALNQVATTLTNVATLLTQVATQLGTVVMSVEDVKASIQTLSTLLYVTIVIEIIVLVLVAVVLLRKRT